MLRTFFLVALLVPSMAAAADLSTEIYVDQTRYRACPRAQDGTQYCVESPVERRIADCDFGATCYHMQNGQHYTVRRPVILD